MSVTDTNGMLDTTAPAPPPAASTVSPFARNRQDNWHKAKGAVQRHVGLSQAFSTLRDMNAKDIIRPDQLTTIKLLGQGAFATVEKAT